VTAITAFLPIEEAQKPCPASSAPARRGSPVRPGRSGGGLGAGGPAKLEGHQADPKAPLSRGQRHDDYDVNREKL
jgi:hypothetical protein